MRLVWHAAAFLLGAAVALASVAVHRLAVGALPWGLLLAAAATLSVAEALRTSDGIPRLVASYAAGWVCVLVPAAAGRAEGDLVVAGDLWGYPLMAVGLLLVVAGITALRTGSGPQG